MKKIAIILITALAAFSCAKEPADFVGNDGKTTTEVRFRTSDFNQVSTRATSESWLKDVYVLQYKAGTLIYSTLLNDMMLDRPVEIDGLLSLPAAELDENGKLVNTTNPDVICFLANITDFDGAFDPETTVGTYTELQDYTLSVADADAIGNMEVVPMTGFYYGGIVAETSNQLSVTLDRAMAKINFTLNVDSFKYQGKTPSVLVNSISLCNVPTEITLMNSDRPELPVSGKAGMWANGQKPYPTVNNFVELEETYNIAANKQRNFVAYMPENARGSYDNLITSNKDKHPATIGGVDGLTYIYVDLTFSTDDGVIKNATYKIYLGGTDKGDMNILGNAQYNVTTYIYGANEADTRIDVTPIFDATEVEHGNDIDVQPRANSYMVDADNIPAGFTIPLVQARLGWDYISKSEDGPGTTALDEVTDLIESGNFEIVTLWRTWGAGDASANITGEMVEGSNGGNANKYFAKLSFPAGLQNGNNAVIALVDKADNSKVYWSWHIWITDYVAGATPAETQNGEVHQYFGNAFTKGALKDKYIMDRNLGATWTGGTIDAQPQTTAEAVKTYGLHYQWGRKDPFTGSSNGSTIAVKIYDAAGDEVDINKVENLAISNVLAEAAKNPIDFYTSTSDWTKQDDNLWGNGGKKSVFDPCPAGWHVPVGSADALYNPWAGFGDNNPASVTNGGDGAGVFEWLNTIGGQAGTAGRLYDKDGTKAWYPATGLRRYTNGALSNQGTNGYYWSSSAQSTTSSRILLFSTSSLSSSGSNDRSHAFAIRCVRE